MARICKNCGSELSDTQRFCRSCGKPTGDITESPTQVMPPSFADADVSGGSGYRPQGNTNPQGGPPTSPVHAPVQQYYAHVPPMQAYPRRPGRSWGGIVTVIGVGFFAAIFLVVFLFARASRLARTNLGEKVKAAMEGGGQQLAKGDPITDEGALVSPTKTIWTKTLDLDDSAVIDIRNETGNIQIEAWDQPQAEVKVIKRGGTPEDRANFPVFFTGEEEKLSLQTSRRGRNRGIDVSYQIKLPKEVGKLRIESFSSSITVTGVTGTINAGSMSGSLNLRNIGGEVSAKTVSGGINAVFSEAVEDHALTFKSVSGGIDLLFKGEVNANVDAKTVSGDIRTPSEFGLDVRHQPGSIRATGNLGDGGKTLYIETVSGGIRLSKDTSAPAPAQ